MAVLTFTTSTSDGILARVACAVQDLSPDAVAACRTAPRNRSSERGLTKAFLRDLLSELPATLTPGQLVWGRQTTGPRNYLAFDPCLDPLSLAAITKRTALSFVEACTLVGVDHSTTGEPYFADSRIFVSYGWHGAVVQEQFASLLVAETAADEVYWIDIFAVAQNQTEALEIANNGSDVSSFEDVVRATRETRLYWAPHSAPNPTNRVWCLFEILTTVRLDHALSVFFRRGDLGGGVDNSPPARQLRRLQLDRIRSVDANASFEVDWARIHVQIEATLSPDSEYELEAGELIANVREDDSWERFCDDDPANPAQWCFMKWGVMCVTSLPCDAAAKCARVRLNCSAPFFPLQVSLWWVVSGDRRGRMGGWSDGPPRARPHLQPRRGEGAGGPRFGPQPAREANV